MGFVRKIVGSVYSLASFGCSFSKCHDHYRLLLFNTGAHSGHAGIPIRALLSLDIKFIPGKQNKCHDRSSTSYFLNNQQCNN